MNYARIYNDIINRAINRIVDDYTEKHHIIPKCMGGSNEKSNLVRLTPREHYMAHVLLYKIHNTHSLGVAVQLMCVGSEFHARNNRMYGWLRTKFIKSCSDKMSGEGNPMYGKHHSDEAKKKISEKAKLRVGELNPFHGKTHSESTKRAISETKKGVPGWAHTEESKNKLRKPKPIVVCPHCDKSGGASAMARWHFDNCKVKL